MRSLILRAECGLVQDQLVTHRQKLLSLFSIYLPIFPLKQGGPGVPSHCQHPRFHAQSRSLDQWTLSEHHGTDWTFGATPKTPSGCLLVSVSATYCAGFFFSFELLAFCGHLEEKQSHLHKCGSISLFFPGMRKMNPFLSQTELPVPTNRPWC